MPDDDAITVANLRKVYGTTVAVDDVSFDVSQGEIFGIIGPNGSGKTTTVECVQGLRRQDAGDVSVLGYDPSTHSAAVRRLIGCQLQESALPERLKVWEALDMFASLVPDAADWHTLMAEWGLETKRGATFGSLSGGQQQRLLIALALVNDPEVVFLDEMTTGLDPAARRVAWSLVEQVRDRGTTVVLVTHFMDEAEHLCDRVGVMSDGRIVAVDTPQGLVSTYCPEQTVSFSADRPDLDHLRLDHLRRIEGVTDVVRHGTGVRVLGTGPVLARVAAALVEDGIEPADLRGERGTLEDVFLALTGQNGRLED